MNPLKAKIVEWLEKEKKSPCQYVGDTDDLTSVCLDGWFDIEELLNIVLAEKVLAVKTIPSTCGKCKQKGVNTFGECECSFEDSGLVKRSDVIKILKQ